MTDVTVTFRETNVGDADADALLAAYFTDRVHTWAGTDDAYVPKPATARQFTPPDGVLLIAERSGAPIGIGGARRIPSASGHWFEIKHLYATPASRGTGVGAALLRELEQRAIGFGATDLVLDTNSALKAAERLYTSAGYADVPPFNDNPNATNWYRKSI